MPWDSFEEVDDMYDERFPDTDEAERRAMEDHERVRAREAFWNNYQHNSYFGFQRVNRPNTADRWLHVGNPHSFSTFDDEDGFVFVDRRHAGHPSDVRVKKSTDTQQPPVLPEEKSPVRIKFSAPESKTALFQSEARSNMQRGYNCFDVAIGLSREELVAFALKHKHEIEYRRLLAQEIKTAAMNTAILMNMQAERSVNMHSFSAQSGSFDLYETLDLLETAQKFGTTEEVQWLQSQVQNQLILQEDSSPMESLKKSALPSAMHNRTIQDLVNVYNETNTAIKPMLARCNELLGYREGKRLNIEELRELFSNSLPWVEHKQALMQFAAILETLKPHEDALQAYCESEQVYVDYINKHYGQKQWLAFIPSSSGKYNSSMVDIAARRIDKQIIILQLRGDQFEEQYRTEFKGTGKVYVQFTGSHFLALNCHPVYLSNLQSELKNHGLFKPQASALKEIENPAQIVMDYLC